MRVLLLVIILCVITTTSVFVIFTTSESATTYFPENSLLDRPDMHDFMDDWFSKHLKALNEPSLFERSSNQSSHSYRFLWLRTFHKPLSVRIEIHPDNSATLYAKMTDGAGGYDPGLLIKDINAQLPKETVSIFLRKINNANFWSKATYDTSIQGLDGSEWIVEGIKDGNYHIAYRWSPEEGTFRDLGLYFLELTGIEFKEIY